MNSMPATDAAVISVEPAVAALRLALRKVVEPDAEHSGGDLEQPHLAPVALLAKVGGNRLGALRGRPAPAVEMDPQCRRETFLMLAVRACRWRTARRR